FELLSDGSAIPVFAFKVKEGTPFTVFHISDQLRRSGWQVPAYTMPEDATDVAVLRVVLREGFSRELGRVLLNKLQQAVDELTAHPPQDGTAPVGFAHT
ncbi:MAG: glutamate decarboxylase, partial [Actinomycetota bacterium]|nr:glutamate decarboxylase [Actinomycetota bacterium]